MRNLNLLQWKRLAANPVNRCLVPLTEFCEWTPDKYNLGDGKKPCKDEMWFSVPDQPIFAVAGFWQSTVAGNGFTMVTCDPNELVAAVHPKAMITILKPEHGICGCAGVTRMWSHCSSRIRQAQWSSMVQSSPRATK